MLVLISLKMENLLWTLTLIKNGLNYANISKKLVNNKYYELDMNALENSQEDIIPLLLADVSILTSNKQELLQYVNKFYQKIQEVSQAKDLKSVSTQALGKETLSEQNDTQAKDAVQQDIEQQLNQQKDKDNLSKE